MTLNDLKFEILNWRLTRYKWINLAIGFGALLFYELVARPFYRPYVYAHDLFDFHIADTLGNTLGTVATVFILTGLFSSEKTKGKFLINLTVFSLVLYELAHPLLGKPIDPWDVAATLVTGVICLFVFKRLFD